MKKTLAIKFAVPVAVAIIGVLGASPIGAQTATTEPAEEVAVLTVTKTVDGTAPTDAEFTLHITCTATRIDLEVARRQRRRLRRGHHLRLHRRQRGLRVHRPVAVRGHRDR